MKKFVIPLFLLSISSFSFAADYGTASVIECAGGKGDAVVKVTLNPQATNLSSGQINKLLLGLMSDDSTSVDQFWDSAFANVEKYAGTSVYLRNHAYLFGRQNGYTQDCVQDHSGARKNRLLVIAAGRAGLPALSSSAEGEELSEDTGFVISINTEKNQAVFCDMDGSGVSRSGTILKCSAK